MKLKFAVSLAILIPMLVACGGSSSGGGSNADSQTDTSSGSDNDSDSDNDADSGNSGNDNDSDAGGSDNGGTEPVCCLQEDRTPPPAGSVIVSNNAPIVSNGEDDAPDAGPQRINISRNFSFPGLRFGDFLVLNNAFNSGNTNWIDWRQSIALNDGSPVTVDVNWDWGLESQKNSPFETTAFPELVYGTKSAFERSGDFQQTGLPVEERNRPEIDINYSYSRTAGTTEAPLGAGDTAADASNSEHNVIIESFWHDSCEIVRNGSPQDNQVMEILIWYYHGERLPSGPLDIVDSGVMIGGVPFTVYAKASNFNFLAYVAEDVESSERTSGNISYSDFIDHMKANASDYGVYEVQPTDCFANILFGPEVFQGAGTFTINDFSITRTY